MPRRGATGGLASFRPAVLGLGRVLGLCLTASAAPVSSLAAAPDHHDTNTPVWVLAVSSMTLVLLGGAFAGLTIAYVCPKLTYPRHAKLTLRQIDGSRLHLPPGPIRRPQRTATQKRKTSPHAAQPRKALGPRHLAARQRHR